MISTNQSAINNQQSTITNLLQSNPILGAGNYPEAARLVAQSSRLQRDLLREVQFYHDNPDCDNLRIWRPVHVGKIASYWINRWGDCVLTFKNNRWSAKDIHTNISPSMKKFGTNAYFNIAVNINGRNLRPMLHVLMSDMFIPNDDITKTQRDHVNGNHLDNNAFNLERVTPEENIRRRYYNYYLKQGRPVPDRFLPRISNL